MLKMLTVKPEPILLTQIFAKLTSNGRIHPLSTEVEPRKLAKVLLSNIRLRKKKFTKQILIVKIKS
jgi:hypothetical protein